MADIKKLAEQLVGLTVKDVTELADILKEEHGIEPAAASAVAASATPVVEETDSAPAEAEEEEEEEAEPEEFGGLGDLFG